MNFREEDVVERGSTPENGRGAEKPGREEGDIYARLSWVTEGSQDPLQTQMQSFPLAWGISHGSISTLFMFQDVFSLSSLQKPMLFLLRYVFPVFKASVQEQSKITRLLQLRMM